MRQSSLEIKQQEVTCLQQELDALTTDNNALRQVIEVAFQDHRKYKDECAKSLAQLEADIKSLAVTVQTSPADDFLVDQLSGDVHGLQTELNQLNQQIDQAENDIQTKEQALSELDWLIRGLQDEIEALDNPWQASQPAEPPPESYNPIVDIHP